MYFNYKSLSIELNFKRLTQFPRWFINTETNTTFPMNIGSTSKAVLLPSTFPSQTNHTSELVLGFQQTTVSIRNGLANRSTMSRNTLNSLSQNFKNSSS
jgi:hypothetical protein